MKTQFQVGMILTEEHIELLDSIACGPMCDMGQWAYMDTLAGVVIIDITTTTWILEDVLSDEHTVLVEENDGWTALCQGV